jgi:hypothetical protein
VLLPEHALPPPLPVRLIRRSSILEPVRAGEVNGLPAVEAVGEAAVVALDIIIIIIIIIII